MQKTVPISSIHPNPSNPRIIKDDKFRLLVKSIREFPQMINLRPIVVDENMVILGGNMRYKAILECGIKEVPIMIAEGLTEEQKQEFIIKDNAGFGEWDMELLANEWDHLPLSDWGIDLPADWQNDASTEEVETPPIAPSDIQLGDIFQIGHHRLMCGDAKDKGHVEQLMNGRKGDLAVTDPPYGVDYVGKTTQKLEVHHDDKPGLPNLLKLAFKNYDASLKEGAPIYICHPAGTNSIVFGNACLKQGWKIHQTLVWVKDKMVMGHSDYHYKHEPVLLCYKPGTGRVGRGSKNWYGDNSQVSVLEFDRPTASHEHPTSKPIALLGLFIQNSSSTVDIVLDFFMGGGATLIAAHELNRICYGMEIDPIYCSVILRRIKSLDPDIIITCNRKELNLDKELNYGRI